MPAKFIIRKLPPHWLFVPPRRGVRELLAELSADVRLVEFMGTGSGKSPERVSLGFMESRVDQGSWCFYLRLWGVREALARPVVDELSKAALSEIKRYIRSCLAQRAADTIKPAQMYLDFCIKDGNVHSNCRIKTKDRYSFPTVKRWEARFQGDRGETEAGPSARLSAPGSDKGECL